MKKIIEIIKKKWLKDTFLTILLIAIIFAIYFGANYGVKQLNLSDIDLTTDKIYSISESTTSKIAQIDNKVTIQLINLSDYVYLVDFANKYTQVNNNIVVEQITDLSSRPDLMNKYSLESSDSLIVIKTEEREETLTLYDLYTYDYTTYEEIDLTEEAITNAIVGVTIEDKPNIYFLEGHNYYTEDYFYTIKNSIKSEANNVNSLNVLVKGQIPEDCDCLVITTLKEDITELERDKVIEYINKGGKLLLLTDPNIMGATLTNFKQILDVYGITISDAILLEQDDNKIMAGFPEFILAEILSDSPISQNLNMNMNICAIDAGKIEFKDEEALNNLGVTYQTIIQTSDSAFLRNNLEISTAYKTNQDIDAGNSIIGALVTKTLENGANSELIIYSNAIFATDQQIPLDQSYYYYTYAVATANNEDVVLNSVAYLTQRTDTITIRKNHDSVNYTVTENQNRMILITIFIVPVLIIIVGIIVWQIRKRK